MDCIDLNQTRFPDKGFEVVPDAFVLEIDAGPDVAFAMLDAQAVEDVCGIEAGVVAELARDDFEGFGEGFNDGLLFVGNVFVGVAVEVGRYFHLRILLLACLYVYEGDEELIYLASTTTCHDALVSDCSLDNHDGIVQTPLDFRNELLGSSSQYQRTCLSCRAIFEEIEPLAADLPLFEVSTCA